MAGHLLEMRAISKEFPGVKALDEVFLYLDKGEVLALVGENGAGKSTLIKILSGAYKQDTGKIFIEEQEIDSGKYTPIVSLGLGISVIYQELNYMGTVSVAENIFVGRLPKKKSGLIDYAKLYSDSMQIQKELGLQDLDPMQEVGSLLTAQKQLLEVARAFARNAKIIVMDEPTASLTDKEIEQLFKIIRNFQERGGSVIYISHKMDEIFKICTSVMVMRDGENVMRSSMEGLSKEAVISSMVGRTLNNMYPMGEHDAKDVVLEVKDLCTDFLKNISLNVHAGEIVALYGLMGSGCEDVTRCIYGIDSCKSGQLYIEGREVGMNNPGESIKNGIAYVPSERKTEGLLLNMPVKANVTLAAIKRFVKKGFLNLKEEDKNTLEWIDTLGIKTPDTSVEAENLSGGNQQKVVFAKCLNVAPKVLLLNEPTRGVDVGAKTEIYKLMNKFCQEGMGILLVSSEMPETMGISDRIVIIHDGRITGMLDRKEQEYDQLAIMRAVLGENV